jgi:hypothetical protein
MFTVAMRAKIGVGAFQTLETAAQSFADSVNAGKKSSRGGRVVISLFGNRQGQ